MKLTYCRKKLWHNNILKTFKVSGLLKYIGKSVKRGCVTLIRRPVFYLVCIVLIPLGMTTFFISLMDKGVAMRVPSAIVDFDHSEMSRSLTRTLGSLQQVEIKYKLDSYAEAMDYVKSDKVNGFFVIPVGFEEKALSGRHPELSYYINFGYFVPGSLLIKGYTTISMLANGALISGTLDAHGVSPDELQPALQPFVNDVHMLGNPTMNYGVYLVNSFAPGVLALMIALVTCYVITAEIKNGTTREWLNAGGGSMLVAMFGKLLPLTVLFTLVGWLMLIIFYVVAQYPMNGEMWTMLLAMFLLVVACQAFAVIVCGIVPNPRYALSVCSLMSVLAFSLGGYSYPVEDMYPCIAVFSYLLPVRFYFLIYVDQALNGLGFVFSRFYYASMLIFPLVSLLVLPRLKKAMKKPVVYVP